MPKSQTMSTNSSLGGVDQNSSCRISFNDIDLEAVVEQEEGQGEEDHGEIELPRLEDSRGSLLHNITGHEQPLELLLMLHRKSRDTLLLSSTMTHESTGAPDNPDWPNASSIRLLGNSRDSVGISERLNNADLCLSVSTATDVSALSASSASASLPAPALPASPAVSASAPPHSAAPSVASLSDATASSLEGEIEVEGGEGESEGESEGEGDSVGPESSPRLRVRAGPADELMEAPQLPGDAQQRPAAAAQLPQQQQHLQQQALGLLQVCRLTLDVFTECGLLREDARRWLTPELLCDKICDRLHRPQLPTAPATGHLFAESSMSDAGAGGGGCELEFESPVGRVRQWLQAAGGGAGVSPSCPLHRVTNTV